LPLGGFGRKFFEVGLLAEDEDPLPGGGEPNVREGLLGPQQDKQGNYHPSSKNKEYLLFETKGWGHKMNNWFEGLYYLYQCFLNFR
jgi:hypothetical protein